VFCLQNIVELCQNRVVVFDNVTEDCMRQAQQLDKLLDVVDSVCANNGGKPFSDQMFTRIKVIYKILIHDWSFSSYFFLVLCRRCMIEKKKCIPWGIRDIQMSRYLS
jgi:hypothetical protein